MRLSPRHHRSLAPARRPHRRDREAAGAATSPKATPTANPSRPREPRGRTKAAADRVETDRVETDRVETERVETDRVETDRVETHRVETHRVEADRVEASIEGQPLPSREPTIPAPLQDADAPPPTAPLMTPSPMRWRTGGLSGRPDPWVTATDIAERAGRSRQSVQQLISGARGPGGFPAAVSGVSRRVRLWRWSEALGWLCAHGLLSEEEQSRARSRARLLAAINAGLALREHAASPRELLEALLTTWAA